MRMDLIIRFDYGSIVPWVRRTSRGLRATAGPDTLSFRTEVELRGQGLHTMADFTIAAGQRLPFTLTWSSTFSPEPEKGEAEQSLCDPEAWWQEWVSRCT